MSRPEPSLFDEVDEGAEERALAEAEAALAGGRLVSHQAMVRWLRSWGTAEESVPPSVGE